MSIAAYNQLVERQRALSQSIEVALNAIVSDLETKLHLAEQQKNLQAEIGITYPHGSADVRAKILDQAARRLEGRDSTGRRDWTTRLATSGGNLEE